MNRKKKEPDYPVFPAEQPSYPISYKMLITGELYVQIANGLRVYTDEASYVKAMTDCPVWNRVPARYSKERRKEVLTQYWQLAHKSLRLVAHELNYPHRQLAMQFGIPERTFSAWTFKEDARNHAECPLHTKLMIYECLGLFPFDIDRQPVITKRSGRRAEL